MLSCSSAQSVRTAATRLFGALATLIGWVGAYQFVIRPSLRSRATPEEIARPLPGNDLVPDAEMTATRSVTVAGSPGEIWPWIVQVEYDRAGFYRYDLIENAAAAVEPIAQQRSSRNLRSWRSVTGSVYSPHLPKRPCRRHSSIKRTL